MNIVNNIGWLRFRSYGSTLRCVLSFLVATLVLQTTTFGQPVGLYEFQDAGDLATATIGNDLVLDNTNGTITSVAGVSSIAGDLAASVGVGDNFSLAHDIGVNSGGQFVNEFTVLFDVFLPVSSDETWRCLLQTNDTNSNDGDYFFRNSDAAIGVSDIGYNDAGVSVGNWYRVVLSADIGNTIAGGTGSFLTTVINESGSSTTYDHLFQDLDGRHSLFPAGAENIVYFFADENGEDNELHVTQLAIYDHAITGSELATLGAPGTSLVSSSGVITPDSVTPTRGDFVSGGIADLAESDNLDYSMRRRQNDTQSRTEFEVKSTSPTATPTVFEFTLEGAVFARSNVVQTIELFDYDAAAWELVDTTNAVRSPNPDSVVTATPGGDLSRFVEAGTMCIEARIHFQSENPRQRFASNTDQTVWTIE